MSQWIIYSDGACSGNPGPGGWGSIVAGLDRVVELGGSESATTNNRMEMTAALRALQALPKNAKDIRIYSDSKYLVDGIRFWILGWKRRDWKTDAGEPVKNQDIWKDLDQLNQIFSPVWTHIDAHVGTPANERCDEIAVAYAKGLTISLYSGSRDDYRIDLTPPVKMVKRDPYYLSVIGGKIYRDMKWPECQARVQGTRGAKFKKVHSEAEEAQVLKLWGVK